MANKYSNNSNSGDSNSGETDQSSSRQSSLGSGFREIRDTVDALRGSKGEKSLVEKSFNKGVDMAMMATATATTGETAFKQGIAIANKVLDGKANAIMSKIEDNPALGHLIQLADKLVDIGKAVPFIAPAFVILKVHHGVDCVPSSSRSLFHFLQSSDSFSWMSL